MPAPLDLATSGPAASSCPDAGASFVDCLARADLKPQPYPHWLLSRALPEADADGIAALPFAPANIGDTMGKRDTNNSTRVYFSPENQARFPVCDRVSRAFQSGPVLDAIQRTCSVDLRGTYLRIEYCQDVEGFWLEPHTDIGVKKFTMLIYLSKDEGSEAWGTDVLASATEFLYSAPFRFNDGLIFIPSDRSWHGFRKRPISGVRKSIIVNFVGPEWRARHELAFPETPVA